MDGDGVLGTDVDVALVRVDGIARDAHGFQNGVGIAFQHGTIHERAGVALVGVADHVLVGGLVDGSELPLEARGEAGAAAAAEAGLSDLFHDLLPGHLGEDLAKSGIAVHGDILLDVLRVDDATVAQRHTELGLVELDVLQGGQLDVLLVGIPVHQTIHDTALQEMLGSDLGHIGDLHPGIEGAIGIDDHDGAAFAKAEAAGAHDLDFILKIQLDDLILHGFGDLGAVRRGTARAATDHYMRTNHSLYPPLLFCGTDGVFRDRPSAQNMLLDDPGDHGRLHLHIGDPFLVALENLHDGLEPAHADAAGLGHGSVVSVLLADLLHKGVEHGASAGGDAAGGHADHDADVAVVLAQSDLILHFVPNRCKFLKTFHSSVPFVVFGCIVSFRLKTVLFVEAFSGPFQNLEAVQWDLIPQGFPHLPRVQVDRFPVGQRMLKEEIHIRAALDETN